MNFLNLTKKSVVWDYWLFEVYELYDPGLSLRSKVVLPIFYIVLVPFHAIFKWLTNFLPVLYVISWYPTVKNLLKALMINSKFQRVWELRVIYGVVCMLLTLWCHKLTKLLRLHGSMNVWWNGKTLDQPINTKNCDVHSKKQLSYCYLFSQVEKKRNNGKLKGSKILCCKTLTAFNMSVYLIAPVNFFCL